mmetsp:Transcript_58853/g.67053  ORF Transcript_58853/g.67053 Transcript_58853/m.67053 type:complete len:90 (+) Transcript_58853:492-761(+)
MPLLRVNSGTNFLNSERGRLDMKMTVVKYEVNREKEEKQEQEELGEQQMQQPKTKSYVPTKSHQKSNASILETCTPLFNFRCKFEQQQK